MSLKEMFIYLVIWENNKISVSMYDV